ncbi:MAG: SDR family NAD(P)-dependent oxidoreductase [Comamonadaceae bacterium]|nr:MAG: SDR family NAD(P)-dependent oxidoreductase [Comamonadaceae bacterium]
MKLHSSVVFVTGANRGLGRAFVHAALDAGAAKVYAAARDTASLDFAGLSQVVPVALDVTVPAQVEAAARDCADVTLLINNAGISRRAMLLSDDALEATRAQLDTNFFGPLLLSRAFAPVLAAQGGGAIVNVLSVLSWLSLPGATPYSVSKAAAWALSNGLRIELAAQGTRVTSLHVGFMDTDMTAGISAPKSSPNTVARLTLDAVEAGLPEVLADDVSLRVKQSLSTPQAAYLHPPAG